MGLDPCLEAAVYNAVQLYKLPHLLRDWEGRLASSLAGLERARESKLGWDALDTVRRVDILDERDLVACRTTLARGDGTVREEVLPNLQSR